MSATQRIVRGQTLFVDIEFLDENGAVITGLTAATLRLAYDVDGVATVTPLALTNAGGGHWTAQWDTSVADAGLLFWWAKSTGSPAAAAQGRLRIEANLANPEA